jgi:anthranilate/para-aminobenzoate synthase component II
MGAKIERSTRPVHGKTSQIWHDGRGLLAGLASPFAGARYHSLIVDRSTIPPEVEISAWTDDGIAMGCRVAGSRTEGVLFHPESFLTEQGSTVFSNFLRE